MGDMYNTIEELMGPGGNDLWELACEEAALDGFSCFIYSDKEKKILC